LATLSRILGTVLSVLLLLGAASPSLAATSCSTISRDDVAELFNAWNSALRVGDPDTVTALYSDDALLLPTLSSEPRTSHAGIRAYFEAFLAGSPQGTVTSRTIGLGCDEAWDAGTYTFRFADGHQVEARYTFVYVLEQGQWRIRHHHSSLAPA
jgi:uncharacterized protein (TIGR02246 family)